MFRVPLGDFFKNVLAYHQNVCFEEGRYTLEWAPSLGTAPGLRFRHNNQDYTVDKYLPFQVTLESNPDLRIAEDVRDIVFATGVLRSTVNEYHAADKPFVTFPRLGDFLTYGMMGVTLVITPIEEREGS